MIDFSVSERTPRRRAEVRLRLRAARRAMEVEDGRQKAARLFAEMALAGADPLSARQASKQVTDRLSALLKPWLAQRVGGEDDLDLIARWYMINAPQLLREAGVDVGRLDGLV